MSEPTRFRSYSRDEWAGIVSRLWPDMEEGEFDRLWKDFCRMKEARAASKSNN